MRTLVLLAVSLLLPLSPLAAAAPPTPQPWPPHNAVSDARDVAIGGLTVAAALAPPSTPTPGQPSNTNADLAILDVENGFAKNGTQSGIVGQANVVAYGRNFTAVSADGLTVVSVGLDPTQLNIGSVANQPPKVRLSFNKLSGATRWSPGAAEANGSVVLGEGIPIGLAVSENGARVVVATQLAGEMLVNAYTLGGSSLVQQFTYRAPGNVSAIAATPDLDTIAVAGQQPEGNDTHAALLTLPFSSGVPAQSHFDRTLNGSSFTSVGIARDGSRVVAGDARGQLHVATGGSMAQPLGLPGASGAVTGVLVAEDASRIAAIVGSSLVMLDGTTAPPAVLYNATHAAGVTDFTGNRTLGLVVLAVNNTGLVGYGDLGAAPLWTLPGAYTRAAVSQDGGYVATAVRGNLSVLRVPRAISLQHEAGGDGAPAKPVKPQGSVTFPLTVRNDGAAVERVRFEFERELDLTLVADPPVVAVAPDQTARVNVTVTTGPLFAGTRSFNVTAVSLTSGIRDDATLTLQLRDIPDVRFLYNDSTDIAMKPGESRLVVLGVSNGGASDAAVGIRATQAVTKGSPWDVSLDPASLTMAPNSVTTVRVNVKAPEGAEDGTSNALHFTLEGANVSDDVTITFRINPTLGVTVDAAGRVKFVEPGGIAYYNVTITNTGSLPRRFEAFYDATPQGGKSWAIDMETSTFLLQPGASRTIPVRIFSPQDAAANVDRVSVLVRARSFPEVANETLAEGNVTLFANAVEPKPTTTTTPTGDTIPGPAAGVVLFAIVAVALLHRRRRG